MNHGPAGAGLSAVVAGGWRLPQWRATVRQARDWIDERVALGVTSFDLRAAADGSLQAASLFGEALAGMPGLRPRLQLIGHGTAGGRDAAAVRREVQALLAALRTEQLDLLLVHRPEGHEHVSDLAAALRPLQSHGLVRQFGACAFDPARLARLHAELPLAAHQFEYSLLHAAPRVDGTLARTHALGLPAMAWSPMAGGRLFTTPDAPARRVRAMLDAVAAEHGVPMPVVAIAWLGRPGSGPAPVIGARRSEVVRWALEATRMPLADSARRRLDDAAGLDLVDDAARSATSCARSIDAEGAPG